MAEVEAEAGAWSTWFLMTRSVFYNLDSSEGERAIARLRELGGRIAHHAVWPHVDLDDRFEPVVAWHNPDPAVHDRADRRRDERDDGAVVRPRPLPLRLEPALAARLPARRARARRVRVAAAARRTRRSGPTTGATMGETMRSFLDADRAARLEHLRADRIDLA